MSLFSTGLPEIIGFTILHSLWQLSLLWIILFALLRLSPKASSAVRYMLAISILILSVLTTGATAVYEWHLHTTNKEISLLLNGSSHSMDIAYISARQTLMPMIIDTLNAFVPILAWLWCAGLVLMGARFGGSFFYLRTLRAQANNAAIPSVWKQELKRLSVALGLSRHVAIAISVRISSPLTLGISPIILLPAGLLSGMSTKQIEAILVHELYHIKRHDYIINICQALIEVLLFYHPAVWNINRIIREERENYCDDQTLAYCGDAITYARALTQIQEISTLPKSSLAMSATGPNGGNFSHRIKRLFNIYPDPAKARSKGIFAIGFLLVYLGIVLASVNVSANQPAETTREYPKTDDANTFSSILSDSILVTDDHLFVPDKIRQQPITVEKATSINLQDADTIVTEPTLDNCLRQVRLMLKMASIYRFPGKSFSVSGFRAADSATFESKPTSFNGNLNFLRMPTFDLIDSTSNETSKQEPVEKFKRSETVQVFPNATNGQLNIAFTPPRDQSHVKIVLADSDGNLVQEITDSFYDSIPAELHVEVSSYNKGIYILQISINDAKSLQRVIIE